MDIIDTIKAFYPESSIRVKLTYNDPAVAQAVFNNLQKSAKLFEFKDFELIDSTAVTVTVKGWAGINILERMALRAKIALFEKK